MVDIAALCANVRAQAEVTPPVVSFPPVYDLVAVLAAYWKERDDLRFILRRAGLDPADYVVVGMIKSCWAAAIEIAWGREGLAALLSAIEAEWPNGGFTPRSGPSDPGHARFDGPPTPDWIVGLVRVEPYGEKRARVTIGGVTIFNGYLPPTARVDTDAEAVAQRMRECIFAASKAAP